MASMISKLNARQIFLQPLYVPVTSAIGFAFVLTLFLWNYPLPGDPIGQKFVSVPEFWVWLALLALMSVFLTIVIAPLWKQFIDLLREQFSGQRMEQRLGLVLMAILGTVIYVLQLATAYGLTFFSRVQLQITFPVGHSDRITILYIYAFMTFLPLIASILLLYKAVLEKASQLESLAKEQDKLFKIAHDLLWYRSLLQSYLLIAGVIVSILPIATAAIRSILLKIGSATEESFPITIVLTYGLFFTVVLILFYVPTHLLLTETSRKLRDILCPINGLSSLEESLHQRKALDEWLQTNIGLAQNLKAGIIALSPLITSFVASVLGIK